MSTATFNDVPLGGSFTIDGQLMVKVAKSIAEGRSRGCILQGKTLVENVVLPTNDIAADWELHAQAIQKLHAAKPAERVQLRALLWSPASPLGIRLQESTRTRLHAA